MFQKAMTRTAALTVLAATTVMGSTAAYAIVVPGSASPERATERFTKTPRPEVGGPAVIESAPDTAQVKIKEGAKFTLKAVKFEGLNGISEQEVQGFAADQIGQKVSLADLRTLTSKVTAQLRNKGFILSRAVLPPQTIDKDGVVKIKIIEGFVSNVSFTGDAVKDSSLLNSMADKIRNSKPLRAEDLERYLLLMEDLPGVTARATLQAAPGVVGASDVIINIKQKAVDASATLDNRGSRFLGPFQGSTSFAANNLFGTYDRTQFRIVTSFNNELKYGEVVHEEQIGSEGTKAVFSASMSDANPGYFLSVNDIEAQTRTFTAAIRHPFIRSRQTNLYGTLEAAVRDTDATTQGNRLYNDRTRTLKGGASYDFVDGLQAVNKTDVSLTKGFGVFDDDPAGGLRSRADGKTSFTKMNAAMSRLQPLSGPFSLLTTASGQFAFNPLLVFQVPSFEF